MTEHEYEQRLRDLGRQPIDAETRAAHFRRIEAAHHTVDTSHSRRFRIASVAAAGIIGFMAGSTALAMADALPAPAQQVAHNMLGAVKIDVPSGKQGKRGPCVSEAAKIKDKEAKQAAMDACPKGGSDNGTDNGAETGPGGSHGNSDEAHGAGNSNHDGDPCHGKPPWAGPMTKEQRDAAKAAAPRDACPAETDDDVAATPGASAQPSTTDDPGDMETTTVVSTTTTVDAPEVGADSDPASTEPPATTNEESATTQAG